MQKEAKLISDVTSKNDNYLRGDIGLEGSVWAPSGYRNVLDPDLVRVHVPTDQFVCLTVCELYPN